MSQLVDTEFGQFRCVTDGGRKWFLLECPVCGEMLPMNEETLAGRSPITHESRHYPGSFCDFAGTHKLGAALLSTMQARVLTGDKPYHDEGRPHQSLRGFDD